MIIDWSDKENIKKLVAESTCHSMVLRKLGLRPSSNMITLKKYIRLYDISTTHFNYVKNLDPHSKKPLTEILVKDSNYNTSHLKKRILNEGLLVNRCAICKMGPEWNKKPLSLHMDHVNGDWKDSRIENLRLLCPNCHSQTKTYGGKNKSRVSSDSRT